MWQIEIEEYNRAAQDSFPAERYYFRTKKEALEFADSVKDSPLQLLDLDYRTF